MKTKLCILQPPIDVEFCAGTSKSYNLLSASSDNTVKIPLSSGV
jgi:glycyl-tRNA synthetase alpha subunit